MATVSRQRQRPGVRTPDVPALRADPEYREFASKLEEIERHRVRVETELAELVAVAEPQPEAGDPSVDSLDLKMRDAMHAPADAHRVETLRARVRQLSETEGEARAQLQRIKAERSRAAIAAMAPAIRELHGRQVEALAVLSESCRDLNALRAEMIARGLDVNFAFRAESSVPPWVAIRLKDLEQAKRFL